MLRRLHPDQPDSFGFTAANQAWAEAQVAKYPEGRQASAVIPLLWRAQEQEGWLTRPAIEHVARMLDMAFIRALEVATFYFMFQLQPVGSVANIQICGTTTCMICGAEDLVAVCKERIAKRPHTLSSDGKFSWEEVECLGACANAPMAMIGKDYYEDLTADKLRWILDELAAGRVPPPGPQNGRFASEPAGGLTSLRPEGGPDQAHNGSVALALAIGDTVKRIDGSEVPLVAPWRDSPRTPRAAVRPVHPHPGAGAVIDETGVTTEEAPAKSKAVPPPANDLAREARPAMLDAAQGAADDLQKITGIGPVLEKKLNDLGVFHYWQIAAWNDDEIVWVDDNLNFKGRITRDDWISQARALSDADSKDR